MPDRFAKFGGIDFSGAKEPLANLWTAVGEEAGGRLLIRDVRPHAFRADLAAYVHDGWRSSFPSDGDGAILWGADFPFGLPRVVAETIVPGGAWPAVAAWVADRPPDEVRAAAEAHAKTTRAGDTPGALAPLDLRLYKQTVEGIRWLHDLVEHGDVSIHPQAAVPDAPISIVEVYPSYTLQDLGLPRRRAPSRPGESRARAAALRTFITFANPTCEALAVTLEDAWDATIACLTAYLCRDDLEQPFRVAPDAASADIEREGWIYRPPAALESRSR